MGESGVNIKRRRPETYLGIRLEIRYNFVFVAIPMVALMKGIANRDSFIYITVLASLVFTVVTMASSKAFGMPLFRP